MTPKSPMGSVDLTALAYEEWIALVFDHPVRDNPSEDAWYWEEGWEFTCHNAATSVAYLTRMCTEMLPLSKRFTFPQIDQGIWFLFMGCRCTEAVFDHSVPLRDRIGCIESMYIPFETVVAGSEVEEMENCFYMWWDLLSDSFHASEAQTRTELCDAMFATLVRILRLDDSRCQSYALHGLGHLRHPRGPEVIDEYLREHGSEMDSKQMAWVQECRAGTVM